MTVYSTDYKLQLDEEAQYEAPQQAGWEPVTEKKINDMQDRDSNMKKRLRGLRLVVRVATFVLACFMLYTQVFVLDKYLNTRGIIRDGRNPWANNTVLWPTLVLLITSAITVLISGATLISYFWGVKRANWAAMKIYMPWVVTVVTVQLGIWIGTMIAYRVGKTGEDLWGWSCSDKANGIQLKFGEVNFSFSCNIQTGAWIASIAQVVVFTLSCTAWFLAWRRNKHQKKLRQRESLLSARPVSYEPSTQLPQSH